MIKHITVIGAGSTGHAVAAIMAMRGFQVTFHDDARFSKELDAVKELGFIQLRGKIRGAGSPAKTTTDAAEAIFVHVPSDRHEEIARRIAPHLEDGQHILIIPGNLGAFIFRRVFQEAGRHRQGHPDREGGQLLPLPPVRSGGGNRRPAPESQGQSGLPSRLRHGEGPKGPGGRGGVQRQCQCV